MLSGYAVHYEPPTQAVELTATPVPHALSPLLTPLKCGEGEIRAF